jgi:hypothetical protein
MFERGVFADAAELLSSCEAGLKFRPEADEAAAAKEGLGSAGSGRDKAAALENRALTGVSKARRSSF